MVIKKLNKIIYTIILICFFGGSNVYSAPDFCLSLRVPLSFGPQKKEATGVVADSNEVKLFGVEIKFAEGFPEHLIEHIKKLLYGYDVQRLCQRIGRKNIVKSILISYDIRSPFNISIVNQEAGQKINLKIGSSFRVDNNIEFKHEFYHMLYYDDKLHEIYLQLMPEGNLLWKEDMKLSKIVWHFCVLIEHVDLFRKMILGGDRADAVEYLNDVFTGMDYFLPPPSQKDMAISLVANAYLVHVTPFRLAGEEKTAVELEDKLKKVFRSLYLPSNKQNELISIIQQGKSLAEGIAALMPPDKVFPSFADIQRVVSIAIQSKNTVVAEVTDKAGFKSLIGFEKSDVGLQEAAEGRGIVIVVYSENRVGL
jgi:hypothetical protein